jgi:protein involved in polysaccharide export with SLBB domain
VTLPLLGTVKAAGLTPPKLSAELTRRFSFIDREITQVTVAISQYNSRRVFVMGEVQKPGAYAFAQIPGLWDIIREAGGPTTQASLSRVRIIPPEGKGTPQVIDLDAVITKGDFTVLPQLVPGSTILIPRSETVGPEGDVVFVFGSVVTPGTFPIGAARTVLQAVISAGGPAADANVRAIRVVRPGPVQARVIKIDLNDYTHDGVLFANVQLQPGDTVTVPKSDRRTVWHFSRDLIGAVGDALGTILFFLELGDNNNGDDTTIIVDQPQQPAAP